MMKNSKNTNKETFCKGKVAKVTVVFESSGVVSIPVPDDFDEKDEPALMDYLQKHKYDVLLPAHEDFETRNIRWLDFEDLYVYTPPEQDNIECFVSGMLTPDEYAAFSHYIEPVDKTKSKYWLDDNPVGGVSACADDYGNLMGFVRPVAATADPDDGGWSRSAVLATQGVDTLGVRPVLAVEDFGSYKTPECRKYEKVKRELCIGEKFRKAGHWWTVIHFVERKRGGKYTVAICDDFIGYTDNVEGARQLIEDWAHANELSLSFMKISELSSR